MSFYYKTYYLQKSPLKSQNSHQTPSWNVTNLLLDTINNSHRVLDLLYLLNKKTPKKRRSTKKSPSLTFLPWLISARINKISAREKRVSSQYLLVRASRASLFIRKTTLKVNVCDEGMKIKKKPKMRHWSRGWGIKQTSRQCFFRGRWCFEC